MGRDRLIPDGKDWPEREKDKQKCSVNLLEDAGDSVWDMSR